jgi:hypothetical protein
MEKDSDKQNKGNTKAAKEEEMEHEIPDEPKKTEKGAYPIIVPLCPSKMPSLVCKMTRELCEYSSKPQKCLEYYQKIDQAAYEDLSRMTSDRA